MLRVCVCLLLLFTKVMTGQQKKLTCDAIFDQVSDYKQNSVSSLDSQNGTEMYIQEM